MSLNLSDLLKKAEAKGITQKNPPSPTQLLRPWQQESTLYVPEKEPETNIGQTEVKQETNIGQTQDKPETNVRQIKDKPKTNLRQTKDEPKTQLETQPRTKTKITNELDLGQTRDKLRTNKFFAKLSALNQEILLFIYDECQAIADAETPPLRIEYIAKSCKTTVLSLRKTIQRLEIKKLLIRSDYQPGRGGWTQYKLPAEVYQEIYHIKSTNNLRTNLGQTEDKLKTQLETQLRTSLSSSSSSLSLKETTTTELGEEWNFDISPYRRFGFTLSQLKQLAPLGVISAIDVEQSLIEFTHDLDNNALQSIKTSKLNYLMGLLRKGTPYVSESYQNEAAQADNEMKIRHEKRLLEQQRAAIFVWFEELSEEEKSRVCHAMPTHLMVSYGVSGLLDQAVFNWVKDYYLSKVRSA